MAWNQQRCSLVLGNTSRTAFQNPSAPSPTAGTGAGMPRRLQSRTSRREGRAYRDLERRGPRARPQGRESVRRCLRAKWPKATAKITEHLDVLLAFYDYPAEHWVHLRTTNPIESTFATVRLRQRVIKGPGSRAAGWSGHGHQPASWFGPHGPCRGASSNDRKSASSSVTL